MSSSQPQGFHIAVGDVVALRLPEQSGGGYLWECQIPDEAAGRLVLESNESEAEPGANFGAAPTRVFVLRAVTPGTTMVTLLHRRPWEDQPVERREVLIQATED